MAGGEVSKDGGGGFRDIQGGEVFSFNFLLINLVYKKIN